MIRIILTVIVSLGLGFGLGKLQATIMNSGWEERFAGTRATLAEQRGDFTADQLRQRAVFGKPVLEVVGGTKFDFGTMQHGETRKHEFLFRNKGNGPLNLEMAGSTCKCTVGALDKSVLEPGEETLVTLTWTANTIMPTFGQTATIKTNDGAQTEVRLVVEGSIANSFVMVPNALPLGLIPVSEPLKRTFHVFTYLNESKELTDFVWSDPKTQDHVTITAKKVSLSPDDFPEHVHASMVHEVTVEIRAGLPLGPLGSRVVFSTDQGDKVGTLELPVSGIVTGEMELVGGASFDAKLNMVTIGNVKSNEGASVSIWLAVQGERRDSTIPVIDSILPEESLRVTIGEPKMAGARKLYAIHFEVPKGAPEAYYPGHSSGTFGKVVIKTNHEDSPSLPIYIRMIVK